MTTLLEVSGVSVTFDGFRAINNLSIQVAEQELRAVIGPNGAGKTTLIKMLKGEELPDAGELSLGDSVKLISIEQTREGLTDANSVFEEVTGAVDELELGTATVSSRAYCSWFGFKGGDQQKRVANLSGGERNRVQLAKLLRAGGNVLLMDEPTNGADGRETGSFETRPPSSKLLLSLSSLLSHSHTFPLSCGSDLDVDTMRSLEEALLDFAGCVVVVSHDRYFLDRLCTHILAAEGEGQWTWFEGNFQEYEADRVKRMGDEELRPMKFATLASI